MAGAVARADTAVTRIEVTLRAGPGDSHPSLATYAAGVTAAVLETKGRWIKIKIADTVGWIVRTALVETGPTPGDEPVATARHLAVRVSAPSATLRAHPAIDAPAVATVARGAELAVLDGATPHWLEVEGDGAHGWIETAAVADRAADGPPPPPPVAPRPRPAPMVRRWSVDGAVLLGYRSLAQRFASNAIGGLADYVVDADASAAMARLAVVTRPARPIVIGLDATTALTYSSPGISYQGPTLPSGQVPFSMFEAGVTARAGYHVGALDAAVTAGGRYQAFVTDDVANPALIARERLLAASIGVRFDLAPASSAARLALGVELLVIGDRAQTPGLRDGTSAAPRRIGAEVTAGYPLTGRLELRGEFAYQRATTTWTGMSERWAEVTAAERIDRAIAINLGLGVRL